MAYAVFPCGCKFELMAGDQDVKITELNKELPRLKYDIYTDSRLDCQATWDLLKEGKTVGVFQLEKSLGQVWSKRIQPDRLEIHGALMALLRPGCLKAVSGKPAKSMTTRYKDRRLRNEEVSYFDVKELEPILQSTYGVLVYQEQAMQIAVAIAGFNPQEADILRKAIGKKKAEIMSQVKESFIEGCKKTGIVDEEKAEEIFSWIRESQRYSFNKSHAITYGLNSFWSAYCKTHFPLQFYCSYLRGAAWKQETYDEIRTLVSDARRLGISINTPDLRHQQTLCYIKENSIYFGLLDVRDIGESAIDKLKVQLREIELLLDKKIDKWCWLDYLIYGDRLGKKITRALIHSGALDFLGKTRTCMIFEFDLWSMLTDKERLWIYSHQYGQFNGSAKRTKAKWSTLKEALQACCRTKKEGGGCHDHRRVKIVNSLILELEKPPHSLNDSSNFIIWAEERYLGIPINSSLIDACEESFYANATCMEVEKSTSPYIVVAVEIVRMQPHKTKGGKNPGSEMAFLIVQDNTSVLDNVLCFPNEWKLYRDLLQEGNTVLIQLNRLREGGFNIRKARQI